MRITILRKSILRKRCKEQANAQTYGQKDGQSWIHRVVRLILFSEPTLIKSHYTKKSKMQQSPHEPQLKNELRILEKSIFRKKTKYLTKQPKKQLVAFPPPVSKKARQRKNFYVKFIHLCYQIWNFEWVFMSEPKCRTNIHLTSAFTLHATNTNFQIHYTN